MKDKIILVHYVDIGNLSHIDVKPYIEKISKTFDFNEEEVYSYIIPIRGESRVECINPKLITEEEFTNVKIVLDNAKFAFEKAIEEIGG